MSEIAKAAHTGMGTSYNYFPTKEVLLNELYFHLKRKEAQLIMEGYDATKPVKQRFIYLWKKMMQYFLQEPLDFMFLEQFYYSPTINPEAKHRGERCTDLDDEHDGGAPHTSRIQLDESTGDGGEHLGGAE